MQVALCWSSLRVSRYTTQSCLALHPSIRVKCQLCGQLQCLVSTVQSKTPIYARVHVTCDLVFLFPILVLVVLARLNPSTSEFSLQVDCHSCARHGLPI